MTQKDIIITFASLAVLVGLTLYSYTSYQNLLSLEPTDILQRQKEQIVVDSALTDITIDSLNQEIDLLRFKAIERRDPFDRSRPKVKAKPKPVSIKLPKVDVEPKQSEPEPQKLEEVYNFRGIVILGGKKTFVIERERDNKTLSVNKGDKTKDFSVLETSEKEVVIADNEDTVKVLKVLK